MAAHAECCKKIVKWRFAEVWKRAFRLRSMTGVIEIKDVPHFLKCGTSKWLKDDFQKKKDVQHFPKCWTSGTNYPDKDYIIVDNVFCYQYYHAGSKFYKQII